VGGTLTIRDLDEGVKQKLRIRAAMHQRSMEAEARAILVRAVSEEPFAQSACAETPEERMRLAIDSVRGIWKGRMSTGESMELTRGDAIDDAYTRRDLE
jgi:plasmid stability protein